MYEIYERVNLEKPTLIDEVLPLDHGLREKGRFKCVSESGKEVRVFLQRGQTLQIGEVLKTQCGKHISVKGALESCCIASTEDWLSFAKACYHLGNRHVKVEINDKQLKFVRDHVLEDMLLQLGLSLAFEEAVFSPESGAYAKHGHHH